MTRPTIAPVTQKAHMVNSSESEGFVPKNDDFIENGRETRGQLSANLS